MKFDSIQLLEQKLAAYNHRLRSPWWARLLCVVTGHWWGPAGIACFNCWKVR